MTLIGLTWMDLFDSNIANIREIHVVGLFILFSTIDVGAAVSVVDFLRGPDDILVLADLEHRCHHE